MKAFIFTLLPLMLLSLVWLGMEVQKKPRGTAAPAVAISGPAEGSVVVSQDGLWHATFDVVVTNLGSLQIKSVKIQAKEEGSTWTLVAPIGTTASYSSEVSLPAGVYDVRARVIFKSGSDPVDSNTLHYTITEGSTEPPPDPVPPTDTLVFPVELLCGRIEDPCTEHLPVALSDASAARFITMTVHALVGPHGQGGRLGISLTGSTPFVTPDVMNATCEEPESTFGCFSGVRRTVRLKVPVSGLESGAPIALRYNRTDDLSLGLRVLSLDVTDAQGESLLLNARRQDDPASWAPPLPGAADIEAGNDIWHNRSLIEGPLATNPITVCANCHFEDGEDLAYFAYSNRSITERGKFHGLTQQEAEQVTSYIRSLSVEPLGRPWNPAFQPGPGLGAKPVDAWPAGEGYDALLDADTNMPLPGFSLSGSLSNTELPFSMEMLDWNSWIPRVFPGDAYGSAFFNHKGYTSYANTNWSTLTPAAFATAMTTFGNQADAAKRALTDETNPTAREIDQMLSFYQWAAVKQLEVSMLGGMLDKAQQVYGTSGAARSMLGGARNVFNAGPHIVISNTWNSQNAPYGSPRLNGYRTAQWYTLQLIINDGNKAGGFIKPVDWKYQFRFARQGEDYGVQYPHLYAYTIVKHWQQAYDKPPADWYWRHATLGWVFDQHTGPTWPFHGMNAQARSALLTRLIRAFNGKLYKHAVSAWPRGGDPRGELSPSSATCQDVGSTYKLLAGGDQIPYEDHFYMAVADAREYGVATSAVDSLKAYAQNLWPGCAWSGR